MLETEAASESQRRTQLAGITASLVGGAAWALVVGLTDYELGFVAWGIGGLVGFAMARTTTRRDKRLGAMAAAFAVIGLLLGKVLIGQFVLGPRFERELRGDSTAAVRAAVWQMQRERSFPAAVMAVWDSVPEGDTLSDALYAEMVAVAAAHVDTVPAAERERLAGEYASTVRERVGWFQLVKWQLSLYDALWALLALSTAWGMMSGSRPQATAAPAEPPEPKGEEQGR